MPNKHPEFTILVVEDSRFFSYALCEALQSHFVFPALIRAASVKKALAKIESMRPDMIFLDVNLPDGNGLELTRRLRAEGNNTVICILTNHDLPEYRDEAMRSGADRFFVKGRTDISEIFAAVECTLAPRFRTLIVTEDGTYSDQMSALLSRTRPGGVVACSTDWDEALEIAGSLKPNLVMLRSQADPDRKRSFCEQLQARCADGHMQIVLVGDPGSKTAPPQTAPSAGSGSERARILSSIRARMDGLSSSTWT